VTLRDLIKAAVFEPALFLRRRFDRGRATLLFYHGFPAEDAASFRRQCRYLRKHCHVLSMGEFSGYLRDGRELPAHATVITVDDGRRDFYANAYPALREFGLPATMYLPTAYMDGAWLWFDRYQYVFERASRVRVNCRGLAPLPDAELELTSPAARHNAFHAVVRRAQWLPSERRDRLADELAELLGVNLPERPLDEFTPLTWDEVREMADHGIEFGGHTVSHPILQTLATHEELETEIAGCKARIEEKLQAPVRHFAYPSGREEEIPASAAEIARRAGYETAVTTVPGRACRADSPYWLPRVGSEPGIDSLWFRRCVACVGMPRAGRWKRPSLQKK
jgi:peptidoglycan/xylan/chitin deacetylase (PgdA/CDA1 family)